MKRVLGFILVVVTALSLFGAGPPPRLLALQGRITNMTVELASTVRIEMSIEGEIVKASMKTEPPLAGSGALEGRLRNGWCELSGRLNEGFAIVLRGAINERDFRGTYVVEVPNEPAQYGKFQLAPEPAGSR